MTRAGWLLVLTVFGLPTTLHAQQQQIVVNPTVDGNMVIGFVRPSTATDGAFINNCVYPTAQCATFNAAMCDPNYVGLPIELSIQRGTAATAPVNTKAYYWLQSNNNTCSNDPINANSLWPNPVQGTNTPLLSISSFVGGSQALTVPDDFTPLPDGLQLTTKTLMQTAFPSACAPGGGVAYSRWRICLGIDADNNGAINPVSGSTGDITGYFEFLVGTVLPTAPTLAGTQSLVKRVNVTVNYDTTLEELYGIVVRSSSAAQNVAATDCNQWDSQVQEQLVTVGYGGSSTGSLVITVPGTDGVEYAYCVAAVDVLGNRSAYAGPAHDMPHPECDLLDCYPGSLHTGYGFCGIGLTPGWVAAALSAWLVIRLRRRKPLWKALSTVIK